MILQGFDGRNCSIAMDVRAFKCIRYILSHSEDADFKIASHMMKEDGFDFAPEEIEIVAKQFCLETRQLNAQITNHPEDDEETQQSSEPKAPYLN